MTQRGCFSRCWVAPIPPIRRTENGRRQHGAGTHLRGGSSGSAVPAWSTGPGAEPPRPRTLSTSQHAGSPARRRRGRGRVGHDRPRTVRYEHHLFRRKQSRHQRRPSAARHSLGPAASCADTYVRATRTSLLRASCVVYPRHRACPRGGHYCTHGVRTSRGRAVRTVCCGPTGGFPSPRYSRSCVAC